MKKVNIDGLIKKMTLEEKAAQLTQFNGALVSKTAQADLTGADLRFENLKRETVCSVGSLLNFDPCTKADIQTAAMEDSKKKIPVVFMHDVIHGYKTIFPIPLAMGCSFDTQIAEDCAEMSAKEASAAGVDVTFSPMVDLVRDCRWGRVMESTGEDVYLNGEMGKAFIRGYHKGGLACCVKHFAGYGQAEAGRDYNTTDISDYALHEYYLAAYRECMKENPELVMSSFNLLNGKPVNGQKKLLVDVLRKKWGFDGVLISDYNAVAEMIEHGFCQDGKECAEITLNNELDMEMMSNCYIQNLPALVKEGKVSEELVDKMVKRVLQLKEKLGLFQNPNGKQDTDAYYKMILSKEHRDLCRRAAEKTFVLLKNEGVLPLNKEERVALVGPFSQERNIHGSWGAFGSYKDNANLYEALTQYLGRKVVQADGCTSRLLEQDESGFKRAEKTAKKCDTVLLCMGEHMQDSGEAKSRVNPVVPAIQVRLAKRMKQLKKRVVGVVFAGRPLVLTEVEPYLDAILYVWQPGTEGASAIVRTLYGENNPSGKITMSFPRAVGQCPIHYDEFHGGRRKTVDDDNPKHSHFLGAYIDERNSPLYPFGYGLSYTAFRLADMVCSKTQIKGTGKCTVSAVLTNTGTVAGEEVVQLYIRDTVSSFVRPVKQLKGYRKVCLQAGESVNVSFDVTREQLSYYDDKGNAVCEKGEFEIMLGTSSENLLTTKIQLV